MKDKPTIVILHGWALTGDTFLPLVEALQKRGYRAVSPDLPGFGNAVLPPKPWGLTEYSKWLRACLRTKNIKKPVLFGHSFGGRVLLKLQQLYPDEVYALVLSGTPGYTPVSRIKVIAGLTLTKLGGALFSLPPLLPAKDRARLLWYRFIGARDFFRPQKVMRETFKVITRESLVEPMKAVRCPCLLVWGAEDRMVPVSIARRMKETIPGAKLVVLPEARHGVPFKKAEEVAALVDQFVKKL